MFRDETKSGRREGEKEITLGMGMGRLHYGGVVEELVGQFGHLGKSTDK